MKNFSNPRFKKAKEPAAVVIVGAQPVQATAILHEKPDTLSATAQTEDDAHGREESK
jgi:hypothetical protein